MTLTGPSARRRLAALLLTMSLGAAPALAQPAVPASGTRLDISVTGTARQTPDIAEVSAGVLTEAATASAAMRANADRMSAVVKALKAMGIADRDIQTAGLSLSPRYRYQENSPPELVGYQASNMVRVVVRKIAEAGRIIDTLVGQGANQINGPSFRIDKEDAALDAARQQAMAKAKARADLYARATGLSVKRILLISETGGMMPPQPMPVMRSAMAEAKADTPIEPGENELSVTVNVSYELE